MRKINWLLYPCRSQHVSNCQAAFQMQALLFIFNFSLIYVLPFPIQAYCYQQSTINWKNFSKKKFSHPNTSFKYDYARYI